MFLLCVLIHVCGIIFIIFFIDEVPPPKPAEVQKKEEQIDGVDNPGFATTEGSTLEMRTRNVLKSSTTVQSQTSPEVKKNIIRESLEVFISNFKVFRVLRPYSGRIIVWMVNIGFAIFVFSNSKFFHIFILFLFKLYKFCFHL